MSERFEFTLPIMHETANLTLADPSLVNFYHDIENRIYWLSDEINSYTFDLVQYIVRWNREDKDIPVEQRKPIRLVVDCNGGILSVSETISNIIQMSKTPIYGIAMGFVASGASLLYLACHKKYAMPNVVFLLHKGGCSGVGGSFDEVLAFMRDYEKQMEAMMDFYSEHTLFTPEEIMENIQTDWYVRLPEAQEKGLVDEIITSLDLFN